MMEDDLKQIQTWISQLNHQRLDNFNQLLQAILHPRYVGNAAALLAAFTGEETPHRMALEIVASHPRCPIKPLVTGSIVPLHRLQRELSVLKNSEKPIFLENLGNPDESTAQVSALLQLIPNGAQSAVFLPLISFGTLMGFIGIFWTQTQDFHASQRLFYQMLASVISPIAYHLQARLRNEQYHLDLLLDISQKLLKAHTYEEVLRSMAQIVRSMNASGMNLSELISDDERMTLELRILQEWSAQGYGLIPTGTRYPLSQRDKWLNQKEVMIFEDLSQEDQISRVIYSTAQRVGIHCVVGIPILIGNYPRYILYIGWEEPRSFSRAEHNLFESFQQLLASALDNVRLIEELKTRQYQLDEARRNLSQRLVELIDEERRHIARELHDEVGQQITAVMYYLKSTLNTPAMREKSLDQPLTTVMRNLSELASRVSQMSLMLLPPMLDDFGLIPTLEWHFKSYQEHTRITIDFMHNGFTDRFSAAIETTFFRIAQESLTNIARYANTDKAEITLHYQPNDGLALQIVDYGIGFDVEKKLQSPQSAGLFSMRERAHLIGAELSILSRPDVGTAVQLFLPVQQIVHRQMETPP